MEQAQGRVKNAFVEAMDASIFPGIKKADQQRYFITNRQVVSDLFLQMLIYFCAHYSAMFLIMASYVMSWKADNLKMDSILAGITTAVYGIWCVVEPFRLFLGYEGNLREKVPQLAASFVLSVFPQLPCTLFLAFGQAQVMPFERVANVLLFVLNVVCGFWSFVCTYKLMKHQQAQFFMRQELGGFDEHELDELGELRAGAEDM